MTTPDAPDPLERWEGAASRLVLELAGRLPDEELADLRTLLAERDLHAAVALLGSALAAARPELTADQATIAAAVLEAAGLPAPEPGEPAPAATFARPRGEFAAEVAVVLAGAGEEARAVWLAVRDDGAPVWLVETDAGADVVGRTADVQERLAVAGAEPPRAEVFAEDEELPDYHEDALAAAALLWTRGDLPGPRVAREFDGTGPDGRPVFGNRPRLGGDQRQRVLGYLTSAEVLAAADAGAEDVLDPGAGTPVPLAFRSDGSWVWTDAVAYYLRRHGIAPDARLVEHALAQTAGPGELTRVQVHQAFAAVTVGSPGT